jgi:membrane protein YdbS with pleckstrin-like domain
MGCSAGPTLLPCGFSNGAGSCRAAKPVSRYNGTDWSQEVRMAEMIIRPTMKFIYLGYLLVIVIVVALVVALMRVQWPHEIPAALQPWIPWLPVLLLLWPLKRHLRQHFTKITILDDLLRYETGILGRSTRSILISRVQDVTVRQRIGQRIFGVGDLSIETAGKTSWEAFVNFDRPREIADHINKHSQKGLSKDQLT